MIICKTIQPPSAIVHCIFLFIQVVLYELFTISTAFKNLHNHCSWLNMRVNVHSLWNIYYLNNLITTTISYCYLQLAFLCTTFSHPFFHLTLPPSHWHFVLIILLKLCEPVREVMLCFSVIMLMCRHCVFHRLYFLRAWNLIRMITPLVNHKTFRDITINVELILKTDSFYKFMHRSDIGRMEIFKNKVRGRRILTEAEYFEFFCKCKRITH